MPFKLPHCVRCTVVHARCDDGLVGLHLRVGLAFEFACVCVCACVRVRSGPPELCMRTCVHTTLMCRPSARLDNNNNAKDIDNDLMCHAPWPSSVDGPQQHLRTQFRTYALTRVRTYQRA